MDSVPDYALSLVLKSCVGRNIFNDGYISKQQQLYIVSARVSVLIIRANYKDLKRHKIALES